MSSLLLPRGQWHDSCAPFPSDSHPSQRPFPPTCPGVRGARLGLGRKRPPAAGAGLLGGASVIIPILEELPDAVSAVPGAAEALQSMAKAVAETATQWEQQLQAAAQAGGAEKALEAAALVRPGACGFHLLLLGSPSFLRFFSAYESAW